jgi:ribosome biogenesis GTPase
MRGLILKGIGGFYYVRPEAGGCVYQCRARGVFKKDGVVPTVGDFVEFETLDEDEGVVNEILPRKNIFIRPPIANIDCFIVMIAAARPKPDLAALDKFLVSAEQARTEIIICINKVDLANSDDLRKISSIYQDVYTLVRLSCAEGTGIDGLTPLLRGRVSALAGPSGVGKSTLLNKLLRNGTELETGEVSDRTKRGRHTTRHVEIFDMDFGGMVFDTPGFSSFEIPDAEASELAQFYPEMRGCAGSCKFDDCRHLREPGCAVREALAEGRIAASRYASYERQYEELERNRRRAQAAPRCGVKKAPARRGEADAFVD